MSNTKKVKSVPKEDVFTGSLLLQSEEFEFTPHTLLDRIKYPKENRPVFVLKPLNAKDRHWMESDSKKMQSEGLLWAKQNKIDIKEDENFMILVTKFGEFSDTEARKEIIRKSIVGFKCEDEKLLGKFEEESDGGLSKAIFDRFPIELINLIDAELNKRASLSLNETLGL